MAYAVTPEGTFMDINDAGLKPSRFESREEALGTNIKKTYVDLSEREELLAEIRIKDTSRTSVSGSKTRPERLSRWRSRQGQR